MILPESVVVAEDRDKRVLSWTFHGHKKNRVEVRVMTFKKHFM